MARSVDPEATLWGQAEQILAGIYDALNVANWQRGEAKRHTFPKPLPRPGVEPESQSFGAGDGIAMDEMARRLGWTDRTEALSE